MHGKAYRSTDSHKAILYALGPGHATNVLTVL